MPLSHGVLIAIVITVGAVIFIAALAVGYVVCRPRKKRTTDDEEQGAGQRDDGNASVQLQTLSPARQVLTLGLVLPSSLICKLAEDTNEQNRIIFTFTMMKGTVEVLINPQLHVTRTESHPQRHHRDVFEILLLDQFGTRALENVNTVIIHTNAPDDIWEEIDMFRLFYVQGQDRRSLLAEIERIIETIRLQPPTPA
ncbi:hypothetical protein QQS21_012873 [Conoideocrella luteorostrata]|uniref:Uncharacterized protein n=1 Tax=Conoideocrella luteorostrata TaxID=1105319 RepID=A0AAJ0CAP4_9HYPO|nr:hypothetical protein QQS21_012873 [Conoideocrella luteorostrata]